MLSGRFEANTNTLPGPFIVPRQMRNYETQEHWVSQAFLPAQHPMLSSSPCEEHQTTVNLLQKCSAQVRYNSSLALNWQLLQYLVIGEIWFRVGASGLELEHVYKVAEAGHCCANIRPVTCWPKQIGHGYAPLLGQPVHGTGHLHIPAKFPCSKRRNAQDMICHNLEEVVYSWRT